MGDEKPKTKKNQKRELRDAKIRAMAMDGHTGQEIADQVGLTRQAVSVVLNNEETKRIIKENESKITQLIDKAVKSLEDAIDAGDAPFPGARASALKAAIAVLETKGLIKKKVDLQHSFPKPTIIEKSDGSQEILGATMDDEEKE